MGRAEKKRMTGEERGGGGAGDNSFPAVSTDQKAIGKRRKERKEGMI